MQIIFNARKADDTFIILHNFITQHFSRHACTRRLHEAHIYIISVSINRMLISQLKIFLYVKFMFPPRFNV